VNSNVFNCQVLKSQNIIYVNEGDRASGLPLRVSYNSSSICGDHPVTDCDISLEIAFIPVKFPVEPTLVYLFETLSLTQFLIENAYCQIL